MRTRRAAVVAGVAAFALLAARTADAQSGSLRIRESSLNAFANALGPLTRTQNFRFTLWVPNPFLLPPVVPMDFNCAAVAVVSGINFDITPSATTVRATVNGSICGIGFPAVSLTANVAVSIDATGRALRIQPGPLMMTPHLNILGFGINAPFQVMVHPSLSVPPIPLDAAPFEIETAAGPRTFVLVGRNLSLSRFNGYYEIGGNVRFR